MLEGETVQICVRDDRCEVPYARKQRADHRIAVAADGTEAPAETETADEPKKSGGFSFSNTTQEDEGK